MSEREPEQLDIDDELETWEEWFASLPPADRRRGRVGVSDRGFFEEAAPDSRAVRISLPDVGNSVVNDGRKCPKCGELREIEEFARDRSKASGRKSHCKVCDAAKAKAYYEANRERVIARISARHRSRSE